MSHSMKIFNRIEKTLAEALIKFRSASWCRFRNWDDPSDEFFRGQGLGDNTIVDTLEHLSRTPFASKRLPSLTLKHAELPREK